MTLFTGKKKKEFVHDKFAAVSEKYDLLNSLLSCYVDHYWRWIAARELSAYPGEPVLDLCAGTMPLSHEVARQMARPVIALDFCFDMLKYGVNHMKPWAEKMIFPVCGDGENLPLRDRSCAGITVAFGVRNLSRLDQGLGEMLRILRPGGKLVILEFSRPSNPLFGPVYMWYLHNILPHIGGMISGDGEAYRYLAESITAFHSPPDLASLMEKAGFHAVRYYPLTMGIVHIHTGIRSI